MYNKLGFTLIEVAVVLVLLGLLVGGIVLGADVIENAQMQTVISDVERFKNATKQFQDKYKFLPGDLPTAATYWGTDSDGCPAGGNTPKTTTCNGDGNGKVNDSNTFTNPANKGSAEQESLRFWQHLANAGFIEGAYSGAPFSSNYKPGTNIPKSEVNESAGFIFFYSNAVAGTLGQSGTGPGGAVPQAYVNNYGHIIEFGGNLLSTATSSAFDTAYALKPHQAQMIDRKADDGMPATGNILSFTTNVALNCNDGGDPERYNITGSSDYACSLIFVTGF